MMPFQYKKTGYENLYSWTKQSNANCFYCKKENQPLAHEFIEGKGICHSCLKDFEVGHLGTDRHVLHAIMPKFESHEEARDWLSQYGELVLTDVLDIEEDETVYKYHFINDKAAYEKTPQVLPNGAMIPSEEWMQSYNDVEISSDGHIHIIY